MVYRHRRVHVWTGHAIDHVEEALVGSGLQQRVAHSPVICLADLTGYTRLTEERGDEAAAQGAVLRRPPGVVQRSDHWSRSATTFSAKLSACGTIRGSAADFAGSR